MGGGSQDDPDLSGARTGLCSHSCERAGPQNLHSHTSTAPSVPSRHRGSLCSLTHSCSRLLRAQAPFSAAPVHFFNRGTAVHLRGAGVTMVWAFVPHVLPWSHVCRDHHSVSVCERV